MNGSYSVKNYLVLFLLTMASFAPVPGANGQSLTALVTDAAGRVAYRRAGGGKLLPVQAGATRLVNGDMIVTAGNSKATLRIEGKVVPADAEHPAETSIEIGPKSRILLSRLFSDLSSGGEQVQIGIAQGQVISNVRKINPANERFEVETPTAIAAVRGTKFVSDVSWKGQVVNVEFRVERGKIELFSRAGKRLAALAEGETADIAPNGSSASVSSNAASTSSANGGSALGLLGAGRTGGKLGADTGEGTDTTHAPASTPDEEGDDIGGHHQ